MNLDGSNRRVVVSRRPVPDFLQFGNRTVYQLLREVRWSHDDAAIYFQWNWGNIGGRASHAWTWTAATKTTLTSMPPTLSHWPATSSRPSPITTPAWCTILSPEMPHARNTACAGTRLTRLIVGARDIAHRDHVLAFALREPAAVEPLVHRPARQRSTAHEHEVALLLAEGLTSLAGAAAAQSIARSSWTCAMSSARAVAITSSTV